MSAIGFSPGSPNELDQLRAAYRSLNDITRNLASAQKCLKRQDLRILANRLVVSYVLAYQLSATHNWRETVALSLNV
jgi:hypothetical protein